MFIGFTILAVAIANAVIGSLLYWPVTHGYDFYRPIVLFIATYIAMMAFWWIFIDIYGRLLNKNKQRTKVNKVTRFLLADGIRYIINHSNTRVKIINKHMIPKNERFLFVCNHISNFDPMVSYSFFSKYDIGFITKGSNYKIPLGGRMIPTLFFQSINRDDKLQSLQVMNNSARLISENITSIGVYPEGKRNIELGEFHDGVFSIATKANCPIVVSVIKGTANIHKNFPFKHTLVKHEIIDIVTPEQYEGKTVKQISDEIKTKMQKALAKL